MLISCDGKEIDINEGKTCLNYHFSREFLTFLRKKALFHMIEG
jgi:hypothetical protein